MDSITNNLDFSKHFYPFKLDQHTHLPNTQPTYAFPLSSSFGELLILLLS